MKRFYFIITIILSCGLPMFGQEPADTLKSKQLDEVVVSAKLLERKGNEDIITVTKSMREGTKNVGELLGRVTGVFYNPLTTDLQYLGSKNIIILVDGVEKNADYIKRLRPERFNKIKITNMPTGIYAGYDAVIDLRTRPLYTGYEGLALAEVVMVPDGNNGEGKSLRSSRSIGQFTYTREKFNIDFSTGYTFNQQGFSDYFERSYPLNGLVETTLENKGDSPNKLGRNSRYYADVAIDYEINRRHSISAKLSMTPSSSRDDYEYNIVRSFTGRNYNDTVFEKQDIDVKGRMDLLAGLWYRGRVSGWRLNANLAYNHIGYKWCNSVRRSSGYENIDNRKVLSKYVSGGMEASRQSSNSKWMFSLSDNFIFTNYRENRLGTDRKLSGNKSFRNTFNGAVQFQGSDKLSFGLNAGFSVFRNSYKGESDTHVTPKAGAQMMWMPSNKMLMRFNYKVSTQYPSLSRLQNYGQFIDSLMYNVGNPRLKPALNHNLSLSATIFNSVTIEGRYNRMSNSILEYLTPEYGEIPSGAETYYTQCGSVNGTRDSWSVNLTYNKAFGTHWQMSLTGSVVGHSAEYRGVKSSKILPEYSWFVLYQIMNGSLQFYLSGHMQSLSVITPQTKNWCLDDGNALAVSKMLFNNRLQILGMWYIPVHFSDGKWHGGVTSESYRTRYWADNQFRTDNMFQISILYRFNGGKSVRKYNRHSEAVEL